MQLGIVGLIVSDLEKSLDFYRLLGIDIPDDAAEGGYHRQLLDSGMMFFWDSYEITHSYDPDWEPSPAGHRRVVLEFGFDEPGEVDAKHDEMVAAGYSSRLTPRYVEQARYATVIDPDGNEIGLRHPAVS